MKNIKIKIVSAAIAFCIIALFALQNKAFFSSGHIFTINLLLYKYDTPLISNVILLAISFLLGFLAAFSLSLMDRFKSKNIIDGLEKEIASLKTTSKAQTLNDNTCFDKDDTVSNKAAENNIKKSATEESSNADEGAGADMETDMKNDDVGEKPV